VGWKSEIRVKEPPALTISGSAEESAELALTVLPLPLSTTTGLLTPLS
jgi:hypothetical protein